MNSLMLNALKRLEQGEVFAISRTVDPHWALVRVPQARTAGFCSRSLHMRA